MSPHKDKGAAGQKVKSNLGKIKNLLLGVGFKIKSLMWPKKVSFFLFGANFFV